MRKKQKIKCSKRTLKFLKENPNILVLARAYNRRRRKIFRNIKFNTFAGRIIKTFRIQYNSKLLFNILEVLAFDSDKVKNTWGAKRLPGRVKNKEN